MLSLPLALFFTIQMEALDQIQLLLDSNSSAIWFDTTIVGTRERK